MNDERIDETDPDEEYRVNEDQADALALAFYGQQKIDDDAWLAWYFKQVDCE
jgi:hypothetical protein